MQEHLKDFDLSDKSNSKALMIILGLIVKTMPDESKQSLRRETSALLADLRGKE